MFEVNNFCNFNNFNFQPICELMQANEEKGGSTLVHCVAGRSRSSTLCIAYLLWKDGCQGK